LDPPHLRIGMQPNAIIFKAAVFVALAANALVAEESASRFERVASVFARHCVRCHNDIDREGDFSLQTAESLENSGVVQPGEPDSHLLSVIEPSGDDPPSMPKDADPLAPEEVESIRRWIDAGATWDRGARIEEAVNDSDWWSFRPIEYPDVPATDSDWIRTPIDAFVVAAQAKRGLIFSSEADRRTLIRRLTYDLIGLPPAAEEVEAFVNDPDANAYEKLVDRLLDSKHYGERWARHWLDVVQYADTCGYDKDKLRPNAWPYRDYVIRSLNEDKPYGRFVQEQIAGDVLFPGQPDGILGLGFIAAGPWDFIGHVEVPESKLDGRVARNLDRNDMLANTLNTFCSVTIQCARCHNHKFDPITQHHYYGLQAIFAAVDRAERPYDLDPAAEQRRWDLETELSKQRGERAVLDKEIADAGGTELAAIRQQLADLKKRLVTSKEPAFGYHSAIVKTAETTKWVEVDLGRNVKIDRILLRPCHDDFAGIGAGFGFPVQYEIHVRGAASDESLSNASSTLFVAEGDVPNPGLAPVEVRAAGQSVRFVRVTASKLAPRKDDYIFALAELEVLDDDGNNLALGAAVSALDSIEAPVRWSKQNLVDGVWARPEDPDLAGQLAAATRRQSAILSDIETPDRIARREEINQAIRDAEEQLGSLPVGKMVYAAATNFKPQGNFKPTGGTPRPIHLLHRGDVEKPLDRVRPSLLPLRGEQQQQLEDAATDGQRRVLLAQWLTRAEHPLVWRSIVNRVWQYHFGQGLVSTPNDFGRMGAAPTHPELLDWLATEFRDGGQSLKQLHRLIVTSSVYRQSSEFHASNHQLDGSNQYLWRMNRRRLSAEEIRDSILAISGSLDPSMGGPGFYLFKLEKTEHSPHFEYHKFDPSDPASHRRSIYRFIARSQPDPYMTTLDCADSSQSTPKRVETLTALQALSLLNNRFSLQMAQRFADRLQAERDDLPSQLDRAFWLLVQREPTDDERTRLAEYAGQHGLANACRLLFNLSEFVFLD
jgi:hypothetical protein